MSINDITPQSLARHSQDVNPKKAELKSSHGACRKANNDNKDNAKIAALESLDVNSLDYFNELLEW